MRKTLQICILTVLCLLTAGTAVTYAQAYEPVPVTISKDKVKIGGKIYYSHIVQERQTLFSISRAYGVTIQEITDMNPAISADGAGLTKNSIILIPVKDAETSRETGQESVVQTGEYRTHTVKWYENLDDIAAQYGVTVKEIMDANGLASKSIKSRQELRIPVKKAVGQPTPEVPAIATADTVSVAADTLGTLTFNPAPVDTVQAPPYVGTNKVNLTLLLALNSKNGFSGLNMDFYSGALMALKQLEGEGIGTTLNVFDVTGGAVPGIDTLARADIIIGPSAPADIENVLKITGDSIAVISPLDPKSAKLSDERHSIFHAAANNDYQLQDLASWIHKNQGANSKVAVVAPRTASGSVAEKIKGLLDKEGVKYTVVSDGSSLYTTLRKGRYSDIVLASENEYAVTDMLTTLETLSKEYSFNTYAPNKARNFKELDTDIFYPVNMHMSSAYFTDEGDSKVSDFFSRYWDVFQFEPNQFALQGYDVTYYFVKLYSVYGAKWKEYAHEMDMSLLHSDIKMRPNEIGSLVNKAVRRVVYQKDMTVTLEP